jgi:hypothetical protein
MPAIDDDARPQGLPRLVLARVSLLVAVALTVTASVKPIEGVAQGRVGHERDVARQLAISVQHVVQRLVRKDDIKPTPWIAKADSRITQSFAAASLGDRRDASRPTLLRVELLNLPPPVRA